MARRDIVFIAWGERHIQDAARCLASPGFPSYPVTLITDLGTPTDALPAHVQVMRHAFALPGKERKAEALANLPQDWETVLFLDTDTRVLLDISLGFDKAERHGVAMAPAPHYSLGDVRAFSAFMLRRGVEPRGQLIYNSGVLFLSLGYPGVRQVLDEAAALARLEPQAQWGDQAHLSLAMEMAGFNPYTLSPSFNHRGFGELVSGDVRIWHSESEPPGDAHRLTPGYLHRYEKGRFVRVMEVPLQPKTAHDANRS